MYYKQEIGKYGEDSVAKYLSEKRYKIINRNFRCKNGEIDIIAKDKDEIVFIEVKTRTNLEYGLPAEAVDKNKKNHIRKVAEYFIYKNDMINNYCRFDVIEVFITNDKYEIIHLKNVEIN